MKKVKLGIIGCGNISPIYIKNATTMFADYLEVTACASRSLESAKARASEFGIPKACTVEELLADSEIELVVNLATPDAHFDVCERILDAGKHVYVEKPLAITREEGRQLLDKSAAKGLLIGGAPDTFLGGALQTCRRLIDEGAIGQPVAATAFMACHGHEHWHPNPEFYYKIGGGPMLDMGPYYMTALVSLLGPVAKIKSTARKTFADRTITSQPKYGQKFQVEVPTHVTSLLEFAGGAVGTVIFSFDVWQANLPFIEIHGTEGSLSVPDPNTFGGSIRLFGRGAQAWADVPIEQGYTENSRGLGIADMAYALRHGSPHRASGELLYHVLDIMQTACEATDGDAAVVVSSTCERPRSFDGKSFS